MSAFADVDALVAAMQSAPGMRAKVEGLRAARFTVGPQKFERLLWLALTEAACVGARMVLDEQKRETQ